MTVKTFTCITCPEGCEIRAELDETGAVAAVSGNRCVRGEQYVRREAVHPVRSISSTVRLINGSVPVLPVRTEQPVPKEQIHAVMAEIRAAQMQAPVRRGQTVIENVAGTGVRIIAAADAEACRCKIG